MNVEAGIVVIWLGKLIDVSELQFLNKASPIYPISSGSFKDFRFRHPEKAPYSIVFNVSGNFREFRLEHPEKASAPIVVNASGNFREFKL